MDGYGSFISDLFGLAGTGYQGYTTQKAAEANKKAAEKTAAAQNRSTAAIMDTVKKFAPWIIGIGGLIVVALLFGKRGK